MNGLPWKSMRVSPLLLGVVAALGGCADIHRAISLPPVNPESPVAGVVQRATYARIPAPSFLDVPPAPRNVPTAVEVKASVVGMVHCRRALVAWAPAHPPMVSDLTAFASTERAQVDNNPSDVPTAADAAQMQAEEDKLRQYAAPPPEITSGPPPSASEAMPPGSAAAAPPSATRRAARSPSRRPPRTTAGAARAAPATPEPLPPADIEPGIIAIAPPLPAPLGDPLLNHCR